MNNQLIVQKVLNKHFTTKKIHIQVGLQINKKLSNQKHIRE